jgi:hypothetical protein
MLLDHRVASGLKMISLCQRAGHNGPASSLKRSGFTLCSQRANAGQCILEMMIIDI